MLKYIHVKNLEKFHPGYKDRTLTWAKINFNMVQGDPDCELITNETDWGRLIKFILLELQAKKPIPLDEGYLKKKNFNPKNRPISKTLQVLHNFIDIVTEDGTPVTEEKKSCVLYKRRKDIDSNSVTENKKKKEEPKTLYLDFVYLSKNEFEKLCEKFGEVITNDWIGTLNEGIGSKGYKYDSHYHTILAWHRKKEREEEEEKKEGKKRYDEE
ncbi:MAG TPA: hypothetical protein ENH85_13210 [Candidatus Scalindua sp.]|nr:hypothetical protein [Candidatus Scalindua sp.]